MELAYAEKQITLKYSAPMGGPDAFQIDENHFALRKN